MKALLGKELCRENGSCVDDVKQNGKANGFANGSHKDKKEEDGNVTMDTEEEEAKSPPASKGKGGRKSKGSTDTKSESETWFVVIKLIVFKYSQKDQ